MTSDFDPIDMAVELLGSAAIDLAAGRQETSLDSAERALAMLCQHSGADHPDAANAHLAVGAAHEFGEDYPAAIISYRRAAAIMDLYLDRLDDDDLLGRLLIQAHTAIGHIQRMMGDLVAAHETLTATVTMAETCLGHDDPDTGWALNALGIVCKYAGRFAEGAVHYRRALTIIELNDGSDDDAATIWHNIGGLAFDAGDYEAALEPARRAAELREGSCGADHPDVAADIAALAAIVEGLGRHAEAAELNKRALVILEANPGCAYDLAVLHNNLGVAAASRGDGAAADHYRQALVIKKRLLGPNHPDVAITLHNIGALAADTGDIARAVEHLSRALAILDDALGPDHPKTRRSRDVLASLRPARAEHDAG